MCRPPHSRRGTNRAAVVSPAGAAPFQPKKAFDVITEIGLVLGTTGNLRNAAKAIGIEKYRNLSPMREALRTWTQNIYTSASSELEALITAGPTNVPD